MGLFPEAALQAVQARLRELLQARAIPLAGFYYCPHAAARRCGCRKPAPGLLVRAAREHRLRLADSWMIGDILDDVEAGRRAGCRTILVDNGNETEWRLNERRRPELIVRDLRDAASRVLETQPA
jgi:D-glycero-D-manno-heptose 1,7-bisphosphate phosphatase